MASREIREDQHGTPYCYKVLGCRCDACREAARVDRRDYYERNRDRVLAHDREYQELNRARINARGRAYYQRNRAGRIREYRESNREYIRQTAREQIARYQSESLATAASQGAPWQPHEDALLARVPNSISAASALGRTYGAVVRRRYRLRRAGLLASPATTRTPA